MSDTIYDRMAAATGLSRAVVKEAAMGIAYGVPCLDATPEQMVTIKTMLEAHFTAEYNRRQDDLQQARDDYAEFRQVS
jgi:predicted RNA polymerase sigma factor